MKHGTLLPAATWSAQDCLERAMPYPILDTGLFANKHGNTSSNQQI
jgi:hypothetical protein